jgi:hypothetical protein
MPLDFQISSWLAAQFTVKLNAIVLDALPEVAVTVKL